jgi:hypothetical protein
MNQSQSQDNWLSLLDYSFQTGVSLSTLRRQIKSNKIKFRLQDGKYLICSDKPLESLPTPRFDENETLKKELERLRQEVTELQMLVKIYENESMKNVPEMKL